MKQFLEFLLRIANAREQWEEKQEDKQEEQQEEKEKEEQLIPVKIGPGERARYPQTSCSTVRIRWVSESDPEKYRDPVPKTEVFSPLAGFHAAGHHYGNLSQLYRKTADSGDWAVDIYGRKVLCFKKRFPCFDSYDYLYETRYYRWFLLREGNKFWRIQVTDESNMIYVTEDVLDLEVDLWSKLEEWKDSAF